MEDIPSGNVLHSYGKWTIETGYLPIQIVIFHSYVWITIRGTHDLPMVFPGHGFGGWCEEMAGGDFRLDPAGGDSRDLAVSRRSVGRRWMEGWMVNGWMVNHPGKKMAELFRWVKYVKYDDLPRWMDEVHQNYWLASGKHTNSHSKWPNMTVDLPIQDGDFL